MKLIWIFGRCQGCTIEWVGWSQRVHAITLYHVLIIFWRGAFRWHLIYVLLLNDECVIAEFPPVRLEELECPSVEGRLLHLIRTTNRDGSSRTGAVSSRTDSAPTPELICAVMSDLDSYLNYAETVASTCPHCNLPESQCVEVLFGCQMCHY